LDLRNSMLFDIPALPVLDAGNGAATTSLEPYWGTPYTDSAGTVYDGSSGWSVVDNYSCNSPPCGGFSVGSGYGNVVAGADMAGSQSLADSAQTTSLNPFYGTPYMDSYGNTYTGDNGYTVTDSYSCGSGACGGFSMGSGYGAPPAAGADMAGTQSLVEGGAPTTSLEPFHGTPYMDSYGNTYTGDNGYTVTDSYSCHSGACGGFSMGSGYGPVTPALAPPVAAETPSVGGPSKAVKASAGHYLMCGHAMLLGALATAGALADKLAAGREVSGEALQSEFEARSHEAAKAVSPASAFLLSHQLFAKEAKN